MPDGSACCPLKFRFQLTKGRIKEVPLKPLSSSFDSVRQPGEFRPRSNYDCCAGIFPFPYIMRSRARPPSSCDLDSRSLPDVRGCRISDSDAIGWFMSLLRLVVICSKNVGKQLTEFTALSTSTTVTLWRSPMAYLKTTLEIGSGRREVLV
jgi:hypothetical protein